MKTEKLIEKLTKEATDASLATWVAELIRERDAANALARQYERVSNICEQNMLEAEAANLKLERECNSWKAAHDNQVKLKQIISDRPDLKERAKLVAELIEERDAYKNALCSINENLNISIMLTKKLCENSFVTEH